MSDTHAYWSNADELALIARLAELLPVEKSRHSLLGYLVSSDKRTDWGNLDKNACIEFAKKKLANLGATPR